MDGLDRQNQHSTNLPAGTATTPKSTPSYAACSVIGSPPAARAHSTSASLSSTMSRPGSQFDVYGASHRRRIETTDASVMNGKVVLADPWDLERKFHNTQISRNDLTDALIERMHTRLQIFLRETELKQVPITMRFIDVEMILLCGFHPFPDSSPRWNKEAYDLVESFFGGCKSNQLRLQCFLYALEELCVLYANGFTGDYDMAERRLQRYWNYCTCLKSCTEVHSKG